MSAKDIAIIVGSCVAVISMLGGYAAFLRRTIKEQKDTQMKLTIQEKELEFNRSLQTLEGEKHQALIENQSLKDRVSKLEKKQRIIDDIKLLQIGRETGTSVSEIIDRIIALEQENEDLAIEINQLREMRFALNERLRAFSTTIDAITASQTASVWLSREENLCNWSEAAARAAVSAFPVIDHSPAKFKELCGDLYECLAWVCCSLEAWQAITNPLESEINLRVKDTKIHKYALDWLKQHKIRDDLTFEQAKEVEFYINQLDVIFN